jgi:hypothetical protein
VTEIPPVVADPGPNVVQQFANVHDVSPIHCSLSSWEKMSRRITDFQESSTSPEVDRVVHRG